MSSTPSMPASPLRRQLLARVAALVPAAPGEDCVRVGIDGADGSGKTVFADELAGSLRSSGRSVIRVSVDDFHNARAIRYRRGRNSPMGCWLESYNYPRLSADVLTPLGPGGSRRYRPIAHDLDSDAMLDPPWSVAPPASILILDGLFLHRDELLGVWDLSVFLDVPFEITAARMAERDGTATDLGHASMARYVQAQRLYFAACDPLRRADVVIDNSSFVEPVLSTGQHAATMIKADS